MSLQKNRGMKIVQRILGFLMLSSFLFFVLGEIFLPPENAAVDSTFAVFQSDWRRLKPDGSHEEISVPGRCDADYGEWVTIATILPENQADTYFCIRSMQQDMRIYVGGELREEYSTLDTQPFGKTSTMTYVFFPVYGSDACAELRIEMMTDSFYSGYFNEIYTGEMEHITRHFYGLYAPSAIVAALMLLIGLLVIGACGFVHTFFKREIELYHLGNVIIIASTWLLVESKLRQFFFPNSTMAMLMGFLMVFILPYPFLSYINTVQKARYQRVYMIIGICTIVNYVATLILQLIGIKDFFEIVTSAHIIIVALIVVMAVTIVMDIIRGYVKDYREVAIGFALLMLAGLLEIGLVYVIDAQLNGVFLCLGLVALLFFAVLKAIRDLLNVEREKQAAIAAGESKAKFLANMSHEIRTPINTVIGMNEMILRENKDKAIEEYAHNIKSASRMLLSLVNDILDFSKIEAGKLQIVENEYNLQSMIKEIAFGVDVRVKQKNLGLTVEVDENLPAILKGDDIRIKQILNNLLTNAIKYTEKGSVTLTVGGKRGEKGFYLVMKVADTGIGIQKEDLEKLFDSFQRLELSKNRYIEGSGLGLNITKQLVNAMNGTIDVQSTHGVGSCFTVELPQKIVKEAVAERDVQKEREEDSQGQAFCAPDAHLLVVDDNRMNLKVIEMLLKRAQVQMDFATGGNECLQMTADKKYDLILMDHMMPEPDGIQTLHMLREDNDNPNRETTVIVLTANAIAGTKEQYLNEGFADYLSKPVEPAELEKMLAKYLG